MQTKSMIGGFVIEVLLFVATGFLFAHGSLFWILTFVFGLGWAYHVGKWIEENAVEKSKN